MVKSTQRKSRLDIPVAPNGPFIGRIIPQRKVASLKLATPAIFSTVEQGTTLQLQLLKNSQWVLESHFGAGLLR
jgi:hypothetical protein